MMELCQLLGELGVTASPADAGGCRLEPFPRSTWVRQVLGNQDELFLPHPADFDELARKLRLALAPQAILFDMDGVMVDVSGSYRRAIEDTVRAFGAELEPGEVAAAKREGSCNNDWILTHRLLARRGKNPTLAEVTAVFEDLYQGTAEKAGLHGYAAGKYVGSFIGIAPIDNPQLAIIVLIDEPTTTHYGAEVAAPAFGAIARRALQYLNVPPSAPLPADFAARLAQRKHH